MALAAQALHTLAHWCCVTVRRAAPWQAVAREAEGEQVVFGGRAIRGVLEHEPRLALPRLVGVHRYVRLCDPGRGAARCLRRIEIGRAHV